MRLGQLILLKRSLHEKAASMDRDVDGVRGGWLAQRILCGVISRSDAIYLLFKMKFAMHLCLGIRGV